MITTYDVSIDDVSIYDASIVDAPIDNATILVIPYLRQMCQKWRLMNLLQVLL
jgi:hypothetical protein